MAEHESTEVVPTVTQPMIHRVTVPASVIEPPVTAPGLAATETSSQPPATEKVPPAPTTFELGRSVADLHGSNDPVTWAGGSLELVEVAEHRPSSALDRDPAAKKWMAWTVGGTFGLVLILGFVLSRGGEAEAGDQPDEQVALEIPAAPEPEPTPAPEPTPPPEAKKTKAKPSSRSSTTTAKRDSTLAGTSEKAASTASTSKPAATPSKPAPASNSKPAPAPSKPAPAPSKPAGPNLAPPEEDGSSSKAELPDVSGWDDQDAALGDRSAEE